MATLQECSLYTPAVLNISPCIVSLLLFSFVYMSHCTRLLRVLYGHMLTHSALHRKKH